MATEHGIFTLSLSLDALKTVSVDNADIFHCVFTEDIYSMGLIGKITLFDRYGIKEYGPITGDEKLYITYGKERANLKEFSILKIEKISSVTEFKQGQTSVLELYFTSPYIRNLIMKKFSRSWGRGTKASDIVKDIATKMLSLDNNICEIETSDTYLDNFCMPYWTPAETIRWISTRSKGTKGKCNYGYLFFNNSKKEVNFVTLDNLLNNAEIDRDEYLLESTNQTYINKVLSWQMAGVDHFGVRELGGGSVLGYDSSKKEFLGLETDQSFVYSEAVKKITTLGNSSLFDGESIDNKPQLFNYMYQMTGESDKTILKNMFYNNFIRRYSLQNSVNILVVGHEKRFAGQKINIKWPSMSGKDVFSSMDSGQYLIKSVKHSFNPMSTPFYTQTLHCLKNAYQENKFNSTTGVSGLLDSLMKGIFGLVNL